MSRPRGDLSGEALECIHHLYLCLLRCNILPFSHISPSKAGADSTYLVFLFRSMERRTFYTEYAPHAPPPSPTKLTSFTCAKPNEACPSTLCTLNLVDRKIEAHQTALSPIQQAKTPCPYTSTLLSDNVSETMLQYPHEPMHRMAPVRQVSSASDEDDMTVTNSSCCSSRSSGTNTLVNAPPSQNEVDSHSIAIGVDSQHNIATSLQSGTQPSSPKSPGFRLFNLRSCREAIADAPSRFRFASQSNNASRPQPTVTRGHISSPTPVGSSTIQDIASFSLLRKQNKMQSWPGPCSQLPTADTANIPTATATSKSRKSARGMDGGLPSCAKRLPGNETCPSHKYSLILQPFAEHARGQEEMDEEQATIVEEERSHFSDCSEEDDGETVPSNGRLFNSLGRLNHRSRTRLSWGNLFSKT